MKNPSNPKERNLLKGAIRRVFSRSELRRKVLDDSVIIGYFDTTRPRVTKWCKCTNCGKMEPKYLMQVDHAHPLIPIHKSLEEMSWDEVIDNTWCHESNLKPICKPCHKTKTLAENKERRRLKREKA